ncbi:septal ring lytic transglycosylase RlpA family protein [Candidatus Saccharibacteria bacterium]|nr:septal ring lytic transglycosylase RlpA family protein [Candidatus Saccharibacteria bacterium]NIV03300.1 septal ring lytic transglycosylase RlpA family protein [Calditrichia bacterium]NIV71474.1 septal ring lytic transglycosylase RlpA family protein [Calditrichia bacterium]NIV98022.1 septal ring lytic transglycosylase RlpA family protein [Candidatus Saccharibacteria bacterium]NIW78312.1 septal ring lytic transglycosylase RlpA family protein [Calditrichia bacterium]
MYVGCSPSGAGRVQSHSFETESRDSQNGSTAGRVPEANTNDSRGEKIGLLAQKSQSTEESRNDSADIQHEYNQIFENIDFGVASYYGRKFQGKATANGETYDLNKLTAAHRTLPFGSVCRVTNIGNGKSVFVRINDRGPFVENRIIDLSYRAAKLIGGLRAGTFTVKVEVIEYGYGQ